MRAPTASSYCRLIPSDPFCGYQVFHPPTVWYSTDVKARIASCERHSLNWYDSVIGAEIPSMYRRLFGGSSWFMRFRKVATGWPSTRELPRIAPKINSFLAGTFLFITKPASWIAKITYRSYKYRGYSTDIMTMLPKPGSYIFWTSQPQPQILRCGIRRRVSIFQVNPCQPSEVWKLKALSLWVLVGSGMLK